jgi:hypothetical protein
MTKIIDLQLESSPLVFGRFLLQHFLSSMTKNLWTFDNVSVFVSSWSFLVSHSLVSLLPLLLYFALTDVTIPYSKVFTFGLSVLVDSG